MFKKMSLKAKLCIVGILIGTVPLLCVSLVIFQQNKKIIKVVGEENTKLAYDSLNSIAKGVYSLCETQHELVQENVDSSLNVAREIVTQLGAVTFSEDKAVWNAVNQYTKTSSKIDLPKMLVGDVWLGQNSKMETTSPVVDKVKNLVGGTCTVFQRMNSAGDMLRVSTNVLKNDGNRAIGTFIPKTNPDGKTNPVVSTVLRGETFRGRAYVVNKWYITAYEPIFDANRSVIGILYVGVPQESIASLRKAIMDITVGKTGYVYILDTKGNYVISKGGARDGESIWGAKDSNGHLFIQDICEKALALDSDQIAEQQYPWKNGGDAEAKLKIAKIMYYKPWDWVIGTGSYIDEFQESTLQVKAANKAGNVLWLSITAFSLVMAVVIWVLIAQGITSRIYRIVSRLTDGSEQVASSSAQVSNASQSLAEGATEQAAGLEETSSSLEEMSSMTKQNADNAQQANTLASDARKAADTGTESMSRMSEAISDIQKSSDETAKIIKVIDEIAFQTNLLALNAAVEAARAGEAGKGFAVVAEEVRNLAMRSAEAAKNTSTMIEESVKNSKNGVDIATEVGKVLDEIVEGIGKTSELVGEIAAASQEQAQGIDQVTTAMGQMDKVTQQNAANAEESASASEELSAQAEQMNGSVEELVSLVGGSTQNTTSGSAKKSLSHSDHAFHQIATGTGNKAATNASAKTVAAKAIPLDDNFDDFNG
jgi:methyl-accepting chemotaxis protein